MSINILLPALKEIIYFDILEGLVFMLLFLIDTKIKLSIRKSIFHVFMLGILDYIICNFVSISILMQIVLILGLGSYLSFVLKVKLSRSILIMTKNFFMLFTLEVGIAILFKNLLGVELISMSNDNMKFLYMIPFRVIEISFIYIYYKAIKMMRGGEFDYEKNI